MNILKMPTACDLSLTSFEEAVQTLREQSGGIINTLTLQVHPDELLAAIAVVNEVDFRTRIVVTPVGRPYSWALWLYDNCVWSEGA